MDPFLVTACVSARPFITEGGWLTRAGDPVEVSITMRILGVYRYNAHIYIDRHQLPKFDGEHTSVQLYDEKILENDPIYVSLDQSCVNVISYRTVHRIWVIHKAAKTIQRVMMKWKRPKLTKRILKSIRKILVLFDKSVNPILPKDIVVKVLKENGRRTLISSFPQIVR